MSLSSPHFIAPARSGRLLVVLSLAAGTGCPKAVEREADVGSEVQHASATRQAQPQRPDAGHTAHKVPAASASQTSLWKGLSLSCPLGRTVKTERYSVGGATWCETPQGVRDGPYASWLNDTELEVVGAYRDGRKDGVWTVYHPYGGLSSRGTYVAGLREGLWTWWWPPDAPPEVGQHPRDQKQDEGHFRAGRAVGRWLSWDEHGKPLRHIELQRTLNDLGDRLERYTNAGAKDDFEAALNVFRRLPAAERERLAKNAEVGKMIDENVATDGAGITKAEAEELRAGMR